MKYISHIKELVSGILDNETVTRYPEAYDALTALYNHLDTLEEVQKYMPYKDPGPVIQKLEQSLTQANTKNQELKKVIEELNKDNAHYRDILDQKDQDNKELTRTKDLYEVAKHKLLQFQSQIGDLNKDLGQKNSYIEDLKKQTSDAQCDLDNWVNYKGPELEHKIGILEQKLRIAESLLIGEQKTQYQEQTTPLDIPGNKNLLDKKQEEISYLINLLSEDQLEEFQEYLRTQLPDDQPQYKSRHKKRKSRPKKRRITDR